METRFWHSQCAFYKLHSLVEAWLTCYQSPNSYECCSSAQVVSRRSYLGTDSSIANVAVLSDSDQLCIFMDHCLELMAVVIRSGVPCAVKLTDQSVRGFDISLHHHDHYMSLGLMVESVLCFSLRLSKQTWNHASKTVAIEHCGIKAKLSSKQIETSLASKDGTHGDNMGDACLNIKSCVEC